jgi:hypothetical protein
VKSSLENHIVLFHRALLDQKLQYLDDSGLVMPFPEFVTTAPPPEEGLVRVVRIGFAERDSAAIDLSEAFGVMSQRAMSTPGWDGCFYMPVASIGIMDRKGKIYKDHFVTRLSSNQLNWRFNLPGNVYPNLAFGELVRAAVDDQLMKLLDPSQPDARVMAYKPTTPIAINIAAMYLLAGQHGMYPILLIHICVIVDELKPAARSGETESAQLKACEQITTEEYRLHYANPDMSKLGTVEDILSGLTYGGLIEGWAERIIAAITPNKEQTPSYPPSPTLE